MTRHQTPPTKRIALWVFYAIALVKLLSFIAPGRQHQALDVALMIGGIVMLGSALPAIRRSHRYTVLGLLSAAVAFSLLDTVPLRVWAVGFVRSSGFCLLFTGIMLASRYLDPASVVSAISGPSSGGPTQGRAAPSTDEPSDPPAETGIDAPGEQPAHAASHRPVEAAPDAPGEQPAHAASSRPGLPMLSVLQFLASMGIGLGALFVLQPLYALHQDRPRPTFRALSAGYSLYVAITPLDVVVNLVIGLAGIAFLPYLPVAVAVGVTFIGILALSESRRSFRTAHPDDARSRRRRRQSNSRLRPFLWRILLVVAVVIVGHTIVNTADRISLTGVVLLAVSPVLLWTAGGRDAIRDAVRTHRDRIGGILDVILVLTAATVFSAVFSATGAADVIVTQIERASTANAYLGVLAVVGITALAAVFGVHMLVMVTAIGTILTPVAVGLTAPGFAGMLMFSYLAGMNLSPLVPYTIAAGDVVGGRSSFQAALAGAVPWITVVLVSPIILIALFGR